MKVSDSHQKIWSYAHIRIIDIRHVVMSPGDSLLAYRLPANCFCYSVKGNANIKLAHIQKKVKRFLMLHGTKGSLMDIDDIDEIFEYYLIYYKASLTEVIRRQLFSKHDYKNSTDLNYGFVPLFPLRLMDNVIEMYSLWNRNEKLDRIQINSLIYQFVYDIFRQMETGQGVLIQSNLVSQAIQFVESHYAQSITLEDLSNRLECSPRQLSRLFKETTGSSPIDYLIQTRISKSKELLVNSDATLNEIADRIGQSDGYYFSKMFKKHVGISPIVYRKNASVYHHQQDLPLGTARYDIGEWSFLPYNLIKNDNHYRYNGGAKLMNHNRKMTIIMLLCLTLLLGACSTGGSRSGGSSSNNLGSVNNAGANETVISQPLNISIDSKFGTVDIKKQPERVVALGWGDAETVLSLGVEPIGASDWVGFGGNGTGPWLDGSYHASPTIIGTTEPDYELIASLKPDLILDVKSSGDEQRYQRLSEIATTVGIPEGADRYKTSSEDQLRIIAEALNKVDEGEALLSKVNEAFKTTAAKYSQFSGKTVVVGSYQSSGFGAYVTGSTRIDFVTRLGFVTKPEIEEIESTNFAAKLADERLELLDADLTIMIPIGVEPEEVTKQPLFQKIPSVIDGRALVLDRESSRAFSTGTAPALLWALDHLTPKFAEALDGER